MLAVNRKQSSFYLLPLPAFFRDPSSKQGDLLGPPCAACGETEISAIVST